MQTTDIVKSFIAGGAIAAFRLVRFGANNTQVLQASAAGDSIIGVCHQPLGAALNERCDVALAGIVDVEFGAAVTRGALLTSDANGRAIVAAAAAGTNIRTIGQAMTDAAAAGDIGQVLLSPGSFQG
ncbi:MAG: DUF2190 family protein [Azospirillum sp.]|nr:DUF2190 family protein [Azospirillum sp.]